MVHKNNFAIRIMQIDDEQPRKCYSYNSKASNGLIMKFVDNTFNANFTITPKDSLGINNPNLVNNLQPGLYKIEKTFNDGSIEETVIYKENN